MSPSAAFKHEAAEEKIKKIKTYKRLFLHILLKQNVSSLILINLFPLILLNDRE